MGQQQREEMFDKLSRIIEENGNNDQSYDNYEKSLDILEVLEGLLAYTIYAVSNSPETVRDACEESYVNIKKRALRMMHKEIQEKEQKE